MSNYILQYGKQVPKDAINLSWIDIPEISPDTNVVYIPIVEHMPVNISTYYETAITGSTVEYRYGKGDTANTTDHNLMFRGTVWDNRTSTGIGNNIPTLQVPIQLLPCVEDQTNAWHLMVSDGLINIATTYNSSSYSEDSWIYKVATDNNWATDTDIDVTLVYTLPETLNQAYQIYGVTPTGTSATNIVNELALQGKLEVAETPLYVDANTIQTKFKNIYGITSLTINGKAIVAAITGVYLPVNKYGNLSLPTGIKSIDYDKGLITLTDAIGVNDVISITYKYSATSLEYFGYYDELTSTFHDLDLNPSAGHTYDNGRPTSELISSVIYLYLLPAGMYKMDECLSGTLHFYSALYYTDQLLRWESMPTLVKKSDNAPGTGTTGVEIVLNPSVYGVSEYDSANYSFTDVYPIDDPIIYNESGSNLNIAPAGGVGSIDKYPEALVLAKVFVTPNSIIDTLNVVDTRSRGGGVPENSKLNALTLSDEQEQELSGFWDIADWSGEPAMLNGVVVVELPEELLTGTKGLKQFTEAEIEAIVTKHIAAGIKPIIKYVSN